MVGLSHLADESLMEKAIPVCLITLSVSRDSEENGLIPISYPNQLSEKEKYFSLGGYLITCLFLWGISLEYFQTMKISTFLEAWVFHESNCLFVLFK